LTKQKDVRQFYLDKLKLIRASAVIRNDDEIMTRTAAEFKRLQKLYPKVAKKLKQFVINAVEIEQDDYFTYYENILPQIARDNNAPYFMLNILPQGKETIRRTYSF
jgi:hypothetical protein